MSVTTEKMNSNQQISIVIVEQEKDNIQNLENILSNQKYQVLSQLDIDTAINQVRVSPPDLILLTIELAQQDSFEICRNWKKNLRTRDVPIIFIGNSNDSADVVKNVFQAGASDYIVTPFKTEEVLARINNQLTISQQKQKLQEEIRKRQETEDILRQSRAFVSSILNVSSDGIATIEAVRNFNTGKIDDFRCIAINPQMAKFLNQDNVDLIGETEIRQLTEKIDSQLFPSLVSVVETGKPIKEDFKRTYLSRLLFSLSVCSDILRPG